MNEVNAGLKPCPVCNEPSLQVGFNHWCRNGECPILCFGFDDDKPKGMSPQIDKAMELLVKLRSAMERVDHHVGFVQHVSWARARKEIDAVLTANGYGGKERPYDASSNEEVTQIAHKLK